MTASWRKYEADVASVFESLGCAVQIGSTRKGARGRHAIDVWATTEMFGMEIKWVAECKDWRRSVPKESVLVLFEVVQDVGADHGFLLGERGFQSGAIRFAEKTNITLTSLDTLRTTVESYVHRTRLESMSRLAHNLQSRMHTLLFADELSSVARSSPGPDGWLDVLADLFEIKTITVPKLLAGELLSGVAGSSSERRPGESPNISIASRLDRLETAVLHLETTAELRAAACRKAVSDFASAVRALLECGSMVVELSPRGDEGAERQRLEVAKLMKRVGDSAESVRAVTTGRSREDLHSLMRILIDDIYLLLAESRPSRERWDASARATEEALSHLLVSAS